MAQTITDQQNWGRIALWVGIVIVVLAAAAYLWRGTGLPDADMTPADTPPAVSSEPAPAVTPADPTAPQPAPAQ